MADKVKIKTKLMSYLVFQKMNSFHTLPPKVVFVIIIGFLNK